MYSAVFAFGVFISIFSGGISGEATSGSADIVTEDPITRLTELIQSSSPFSVANVSRSPRAGVKASVDDTRTICGKYNPCGWVTYNKYTRIEEEWTQSSCDCREGTSCERSNDNISIASYEYRCINITSPSTVESSVTEVTTMN